jgi:hypothetical protein
MKIKAIYESEKQDGLLDLLNNNSVAYCSQANLFKTSLDDPQKLMIKEDVLDKVVAGNKDQIDLFYLQSILVSTGWNKNDDVFDPKETWGAKDTPEDKPFNFMHDESDIIGHITGNRVVDFDGSDIDSNSEHPPESFNILTNAVIYKSWSDVDRRERINKIIAEIEEGKWFVSMECLFPAFDYALKNDDGDTRIIQRSEASAFLTKHLRAYGGDGVYENYRIGRLLRNLAFSGKGLVSKPANPRSIILDRNESFDESKSQILTVSSMKENSMSDILESKVAELQSALDQAKADNQKLMEQVASEKATEYKSTFESLESVVAEKTQEITTLSESNESLAASVKELEEASEAMKKDMEEKDKAMKDMKKKEAMMKRKAQLEDAGFESDEAQAAVESFDSIDDAAFDAVVAMMKKKAGMKKGYSKDDESKAEVVAEEEVESAEASEEIIESAEPVEEISVAEVEPEVDPSESLRSVASEWIGSLLQSAPKNK